MSRSILSLKGERVLLLRQFFCTSVTSKSKNVTLNSKNVTLKSKNVTLKSKNVTSKSKNFTLKSKNVSSEREIEREDRDFKKEGIHFNPCNIQMISDQLYEQVFIDLKREKTFSKELIAKCRKHLESHGLWDQKKEVSKPVKFTLPELQGVNIDDHFRNIALQQTHQYKALMNRLIETTLPEIPSQWSFHPGWTKYLNDGTHTPVPFPEEDAFIFDVEVCMSNGQVPTIACAVSTDAWYSWCSQSLIKGINRDPEAKVEFHELIPFETCPGEMYPPSGKWIEKIIIGHNVSYDRTRIKEQYFIEKSKMRFMDTMSLHIAISGITSFQRALKMTMKCRDRQQNAPATDEGMRDVNDEFDWNALSSLNNLADVYKLYCNGPVIKKDQRNVFVKGMLEDVRQDFQNLVSYCARDVTATHEILQKLLPNFYQRFPHPVTLCGMLEMGTAYLPINTNWNRYIEKSEMAFKDMEKEVKSILVEKASQAVKLLDGEKYKEDPWLWDLDWKVTKRRISKTKCPDSNLANSSLTQMQYPAWYKKLLYKPGDENYEPGPSKISSSMQVVPKILRLTWFGFPLHYSKTGGWGFLVKKLNLQKPVQQDFQIFDDSQDESLEKADNASEISMFPYKQWEVIWEAGKTNLTKMLGNLESKTHLDSLQNEIRNKSEDSAQELSDFIKGLEIISGLGVRPKRTYKHFDSITEKSKISKSPHPQCDFIPLPHKNGANYNVGNPLSKDFLSKIEEGILNCQDGQDIANRVVRISKMVSYWRNNRDRILGQMTVWQNNNDGPSINNLTEVQGAILPQVVVSGTLTRRAVEPTWMTASNAYVDRIGSELKAIIQAPPSYHFVGADVDSQELWIASVIGDAYFAGQHGCTALGWMTLQGSKSAGTDMHSKTASLIGIGRDQSKIVNYARIYGAGVSFAERLLMQFNRSMSNSEAKKKATAMYKMTKGVRKYLLNDDGQQLASQIEDFKNRVAEPLSKFELQEIMNYHQFPFREYLTLVEKLVWEDGTESYMFNRLEEIAQNDCPQTPVLGCYISRSLVPSVVQNDYMTSRVNWVVQSSAVDYLHLMLTCMGWLINKYNINARFSLSVHDEVRYLVSSEDRYRTALALQITNLLTRSFCSYRLGMYDMPQSVAFFSCVDIDKALRKEVTDDCVTPSNPDGLNKGYNILQGEALDIWKILKLTDGSLFKKNANED